MEQSAYKGLVEKHRGRILEVERRLWAHPETGAVRDFRVEDLRGLERCLEAVLSDPAPETGQDLPETSAAGEQRVRLGPEGEVVP